MNRGTIYNLIYFVLIYYIFNAFLAIASIILKSPQVLFVYNMLIANIAFIILAILKEHYYD